MEEEEEAEERKRERRRRREPKPAFLLSEGRKGCPSLTTYSPLAHFTLNKIKKTVLSDMEFFFSY